MKMRRRIFLQSKKMRRRIFFQSKKRMRRKILL
jgi:hypothetical protein